MEEKEQPRRGPGFLLAIAVLLAAAATWGAVALASGSGSSSSTGTPAPAAADSSGVQPIAAPSNGHRNCPHDGGQSTTPSTPTTLSATDGSSNPSL
jgi:hypothetical protein